MDADFSRIETAPASDRQDLLEALTHLLASSNYTFEGVQELIGEQAFAALNRDQPVPARIRVQEILAAPSVYPAAQSLASLIALFMTAASLPAQQIDSALDTGNPEFTASYLLRELKIAEDAPGGVRATIDFRPHAADNGTEMWVASDLGAHQRPGVLRTDHVLGIGQASRTLAQFTERTPVRRALDLGTGCGIQTFHLLAHAQHVVATDISVRALAFTRFNLLVNAGALKIDPANLSERVSLRLGSLLEPVAGELFDLVVSNPPFVITPRRANETAQEQFTYRDGGMAGDSLVASLVKELPALLAPGGRVNMLGNWEIPKQEISAPESPNQVDPADWTARLRQWVGEGTEAWFIQREVLSPEQYAETWLRDSSESRDQAAFDAKYCDYLQDFAARGVAEVGFGMIWLRKPETTSQPAHYLQRFEEITYPIQQPIAPFITEAVELHDRLAPLSNTELAHEHLVVAQDVTEERHARPGAEHPGVILLREGAGLRRTVLESTETAGFVSACDGELAVGQIVNALAALLDWEEMSGGTPEEHPQNVLFGHIRELIAHGFLRFDEKS